MLSYRLKEIEKVQENVKLLNEMLDNINPDDVSADVISTIKDLFATCKSLQPTITIMAQDTENTSHLGIYLIITRIMNFLLF